MQFTVQFTPTGRRSHQPRRRARSHARPRSASRNEPRSAPVKKKGGEKNPDEFVRWGLMNFVDGSLKWIL